MAFLTLLLAKALNLGENTTPCDATCEKGMKRIKGSFSLNPFQETR
jgi:hypothetical protein